MSSLETSAEVMCCKLGKYNMRLLLIQNVSVHFSFISCATFEMKCVSHVFPDTY